MSLPSRISSVSLIIPTFNRRHTLEKQLGLLEAQTWQAGPTEVVMVDDYSQDGTFEMLQSYRGSLDLKALRNPTGAPDVYGYISCLNLGAETAQNELAIFLDDDLLPVPTLIEEHVKTHEKWRALGENVVCRGWRTEDLAYDDLDKYSLETDRLYNWKLRYYLDNLDDISPRTCIGNNFSVLREVVHKVGGFGSDKKRYGQDTRVPHNCKKLLQMRCVANVHAFGSHVPVAADLAGEKAKRLQSAPEHTPKKKIDCLTELGRFYVSESQQDKLAALLVEAENIARSELDGDQEALAGLHELCEKSSRTGLLERLFGG